MNSTKDGNDLLSIRRNTISSTLTKDGNEEVNQKIHRLKQYLVTDDRITIYKFNTGVFQDHKNKKCYEQLTLFKKSESG